MIKMRYHCLLENSQCKFRADFCDSLGVYCIHCTFTVAQVLLMLNFWGNVC